MTDDKRERRDDSRPAKGSQDRPLREERDSGRRTYSEEPARKWDTTVQTTDRPPPPPNKK